MLLSFATRISTEYCFGCIFGVSFFTEDVSSENWDLVAANCKALIAPRISPPAEVPRFESKMEDILKFSAVEIALKRLCIRGSGIGLKRNTLQCCLNSRNDGVN